MTAYTDGRERLEFVDLHGAFAVKLDGQPTGMRVYGVYDAVLIRGVLIARPAVYFHTDVLFRYEGEGRWVPLLPPGESVPMQIGRGVGQ